MLDIAPEVESGVRDSAAREGISVNDLLARYFLPEVRAEEETPEQTDRRVRHLLAKWQAKNPLPVPAGGFKSLAELSAEWAGEDEKLTEAERKANRQLWEEHVQAIINSPGVSI